MWLCAFSLQPFPTRRWLLPRAHLTECSPWGLCQVDRFTEENCDQFDDSEENKLVYTSLFSEYTKLIEAHIEEHLGAALKSFDMQSFSKSLAERSDAKVGWVE